MPVIDDEIAAYEGMQQDLETSDIGKWVLIHDQKLVGTFDSFEDAAQEAVRQFGRGPYLIRQVGVSSVTLPAAVMYRLENAHSR